jgi:hypothetical protein
MNKRIKELAVEAGAYVPGVIGRAGGHPAISFQSAESFEKFAELLVKECLSLVEPNTDMKCGEEWYTTLEGTAQEIKEHFGVE